MITHLFGNKEDAVAIPLLINMGTGIKLNITKPNQYHGAPPMHSFSPFFFRPEGDGGVQMYASLCLRPLLERDYFHWTLM